MVDRFRDDPPFHATTILAVVKDGQVAMVGDGQVTLGQQVMKAKARKVRRLCHGKVLGGFAGHTADALTLFERFEAKLEHTQGNLGRAAVDLAKDWRLDRALRRLQALLLVADRSQVLVISGQGDVIEPDEPVAAIGSGAPMALAAARALLRHSSLDATAVASEAMTIAAQMCIYTNEQFTVETLA